MAAVLLVHVEPADTETGVAWWAESPDLAGFYAAGDTLAEMRTAAHEAISDEWGDVDVTEIPFDDGPGTERRDVIIKLVASWICE